MERHEDLGTPPRPLQERTLLGERLICDHHCFPVLKQRCSSRYSRRRHSQETKGTNATTKVQRCLRSFFLGTLRPLQPPLQLGFRSMMSVVLVRGGGGCCRRRSGCWVQFRFRCPRRRGRVH